MEGDTQCMTQPQDYDEDDDAGSSDETTASGGSLEPPWARLIALPPHSALGVRELSSKKTVFGRSPNAGVHIDDARISTAHCTLWRDAASHKVWVQNTSMNGTLVNRQLLEKGATRELKSGDEIQLLNPRTPGAGAEAAPPKPPYVFLFQDLRPPPREPEPLQGALQDTSFVAAAHGGPSSAAAAVQPHQEYVIEGELGRGTFAVVKKVRHARTGARYAMKVMEKKKLQGHLRRASGQTLAGDALKSKVLSEARILKRMSHPGIIKFYDIFETDGPRGELCMVMEVGRPRRRPRPRHSAPLSRPPHPAPLPLQLAEGGELFDDLVERGCFGEADARAIMEQLLRALHYVHSQASPRPPHSSLPPHPLPPEPPPTPALRRRRGSSTATSSPRTS